MICHLPVKLNQEKLPKKMNSLFQFLKLINPGGPQNKSEGMSKKGQVPRPCKRIEKAMEHESDDCASCDCCFWHNN